MTDGSAMAASVTTTTGRRRCRADVPAMKGGRIQFNGAEPAEPLNAVLDLLIQGVVDGRTAEG